MSSNRSWHDDYNESLIERGHVLIDTGFLKTWSGGRGLSEYVKIVEEIYTLPRDKTTTDVKD